MANITNNLTNILNDKGTIENAQYGKDVRSALANLAQAVHDALVAINNAQIASSEIADSSITYDKLSNGVKEQLTAVGKMEVDGKVAAAIVSYIQNASVMISQDGKIGISDRLGQNTTEIQTRICEHIADLSTETETINLNTLREDYNCIDIVADTENPGVDEYQGTNFPAGMQRYLSYGFHFTRLYNVEYFLSFYDQVLWTRKNKGNWVSVDIIQSYG